MTSIIPVRTSLSAQGYDPFSALKKDIKEIVTDAAVDAFTESQPLLQETVTAAATDAFAASQPMIEQTINDVIAAQGPFIRETMGQVVDDQLPKVTELVDGYLDQVKTEIPGIIDTEVARQREAIETQLRDYGTTAGDHIKKEVNSVIAQGAKFGMIGGIGAGVIGAGLGYGAFKNPAGAALAAVSMAFMGATGGFLAGVYSKAS